MKIIANEYNIRIDKYLESKINKSRSEIQKHIKNNDITVNETQIKPSYIVKENDEINIKIIEEDTSINSENIKLDIIYEDNDIIVINKKKGMIVHPSLNNYTNTLVNALLHHTKELSDLSGHSRPGIVHRIDKDTSGLIVIAKNNEAHKNLQLQFKNRTPVRQYIALVDGVVDTDTGTIKAPIGRDIKNRKLLTVTASNSKPALTTFKTLQRFKKATLLEVALNTGRTHQIRVHMKYIKHPIINDLLYNKKQYSKDGLALHSSLLTIIHPITKKTNTFEAELPSEMKKTIESHKENK